jgi:hypothetical protein
MIQHHPTLVTWTDVYKSSGEMFWSNHEFSIISSLDLEISPWKCLNIWNVIARLHIHQHRSTPEHEFLR